METTAPIRTASSALDCGIAAVRALELPAAAEPTRQAALEVADIVRRLDADEDVALAALLAPLLDAGLMEREAAHQRFGEPAVRLARALTQLGEFGLPPDWTPESGLQAAQAEALRKMLVAVIGDVRLVVVKLAEQLQKMRGAKHLEAAQKRKLSIETREVYAPLANRLGVWQLKWELEDLAFRHLQPAEYRHIAAALKLRRAERERYIEELKARLERELRAAGIEARIDGRPKHIYSIWRKMQAKKLAFEEIMDIRAARVLVDSVAECYAALGIVHSLWPFIAGEFDDYIATPKDNLYRSIHTAVLGPGGQPVEIQIRTHQMHAHSERGVAAHWRYKEGGRGDQAYERKINQLRALLAPEEKDSAHDFLERMRIELFQDRIYVLSPKGEIVDVPVGGTPLDFAYQVHTDLGHRTRGAKVNGRMVGLDYRLKNSETVEIIAAKTAHPSRDWLSAQSGFLASPRNRNKVRAWFRKQDEAQNKLEGRALLEREIQRLGVSIPPMPELLHELKLDSAEALHQGLGLGEISPAQVAGAIQRLLHARAERPDESARARPAPPPPELEVEVQGVGELLSTYARCCKPVPPEPIAGYITVGRGVSIHSQSCANLARLASKAPARVLPVSWGAESRGEFPVDIEVQAFDRRGLVRDVSAALADEKISIRSMTTVTDQRDHVAHMRIGIAIAGLPQLSRLLARVAQLPNVVSARRRK
ncbi:MAG TPA: bifunctional (p)ppGpp synthetase/guanosine-3',5'-bis(diphosphate) 3'-pyrophosphohydrolase [Steroidobacteraceae bacterium]|nr:bifunctional (p)ppGpp synthetase/guanosine-3',5'-bis(diphosphate) 3'-pyrophosphohydrolase [Steroidobacteraceae bacterium]